MKEEDKKNLQLIKDTRDKMFDLANSYSGNDVGNASLYLHKAVNNLFAAEEIIRDGNRPQKIPLQDLIACMGLGYGA